MGEKKDHLNIFYLTKMCNLRCDYCYETGKEYYKMSKETIKKNLDDVLGGLEKYDFARFVLFGGEPMLNYEGLLYLLDYTYNTYYPKGINISMSLITNGTLLKPERVRELYKYRKILNIDISIDGDRETHNKHRKFQSGIGSYDIVERNAKFALKYFPFTKARMVVSDVDKFYDNVMYLLNMGFRVFCFQMLRAHDVANPDALGSLSEYTSQEYIEKYLSTIEKLEEYFKTLNNVTINEYTRPHFEEEVERIMNSDDEYHYFLPEGGAVFQKTYVNAEFQHFTKGEKASYNLLNKCNKDDAKCQ
jgi:sulfatase maturation enzyme AslB (radical SAM superfamily)